MSDWIRHESSRELRNRLQGLRNGIEGGWLNMCRRDSDLRTIAEIEVELGRRGADR